MNIGVLHGNEANTAEMSNQGLIGAKPTVGVRGGPRGYVPGLGVGLSGGFPGTVSLGFGVDGYIRAGRDAGATIHKQNLS